MSELLSFDQAARELGITEEELEQLVAAGEIASIKDGNTLHFKKEVVSKFKQKREESDILLSDDVLDLQDEEPVEEIDLLSDDDEGTTPLKPVAEEKPAKAEVGATAGAEPEVDELSLDDIPSLDLDSNDELESISIGSDAESKPGSESDDETLLNMDPILEEDSEATTPVPSESDDPTLVDTDAMGISGDLADDSDPFSADTAEETSASDLTEAGTLLRSGGARVMQMKRKSGSPWPTLFLGVAALLLLLPLGILVNVIFASSEETKKVSSTSASWVTEYNFLESTVESLADMFKPAK